MNNCYIDIDFSVNPKLKTLANFCAKNKNKFYAYIEKAFKEISATGALELTQDFKDKMGYDDVSTVSGVKLKNDIIKYYNITRLGINSNSRTNTAKFDGPLKPYDKAVLFGYTDIQGRIDGINALRLYILSNLNDIKNVNAETKEEISASKHIRQAFKFLENIIIGDIAKYTNSSPKDVRTQLQEKGYSVIQDLVDKGKLDLQVLNRIALYNEFRRYYLSSDESTNYGTQFVEELLSVEEVSHIRKQFNEEDTTQENTAISEEESLEDVDSSSSIAEYDPDTYIQVLSNKSGLVKSFDAHISVNIKTLLNSLPKLLDDERIETGIKDNNGNSITLPNYDLNNSIGLPIGMNANQCATVLYHWINYDTKEIMLQSIKNAAYSIPGMEAFHSLHTILSNNKSLLDEFYCTFSKITVSKIETVIANDEPESRISNKTSNRRSALIFDYLNNIKSVTSRINIDFAEQDLQTLKELFNNYSIIASGQKHEELRLKLEDELYRQLKRYYGNMSRNTIHNYLKLHNQEEIENPIITTKNISNLISYIERTIKGIKKGRIAYDQRQASINEINRRNNQVIQEAEKLQKDVKKEDLIDPSYLYAESFIDKEQESTIVDLSKELIDYTLVNTDLNSRNAKGNQSSDVINSSMISYLKKVLESTLNNNNDDDTPLKNFGRYKFQSQQYDFSNILMEQKIGNQVIYGLFRKVNDTIVPTEYANELLEFNLYNGASNFDDDSHALYGKDMVGADYIATAWIHYFAELETKGKVPRTDYFFRIPSDAPKNFMMRAPKYNITGLIKETKDKDEHTKRTINTNHIIFQAFRRAFIQELTDAATAIDVIFDTKVENTENHKNTHIIGYNEKTGDIAFKDGYSNTNHNGLHPLYHFRNGVIIKDGKLTGNVFKSDRFTTYDNKTNESTNYGQKIIDEAFDFLYGGVNRDSFAFRYTSNNGKLEVVLSKEQNDIIDKYLSDFIADYVRIETDKINDFKDLLKDTEITTNKVADFALNYHLAYISMNDLFEGDTKFYKSAQDFLKRAKESQGSGTPNSITNITAFLGEPKTELENSVLNSTTFGPDGKYKVTPFNKFTAITIRNTIKTDKPMIKRMVEVLSDESIMGKNVLSKKRAKELMAGYEETIINDAQSYITFDEWIRRIAAKGQLPRYKKLIDKLLDKNSILSAKDIKDFVQVQKNFYYDQYYNPKTRTISPRQIKNAELVLVPRFVEGTELEKVLDIMTVYGIDQLNTEETSKAGKSYILDIFDTETGVLKQEIINQLKDTSKATTEFGKLVNAAKEEFDYTFLYTQQETVQHINAMNKAGIQLVKKLFDNIADDSPNKKLKTEFWNVYGENIYDSFSNLMKELNVPISKDGNIILDENGNIEGVNWDVFYSRLRDELVRLGSDSNMTDYFTQSGMYTEETLMPNYYSLNANKLENIAQALFNRNITRQLLPGFHAAQVSSVGYRKLIKDKKDKYETNEALQYHPMLYKNSKDIVITEKEYKTLDKEHKNEFEKYKVAPYIEVLLPAANFGFDRNSEAVKGKTLEEQNNYFLAQLQKEELDVIIGYRMPTEGKQSVCVMKVVGFTDDAQGSTIVVPDAWVSQTGSDFDIDSVYGVQKASYIDNYGIIHRIKYLENDEKLYWNYLRRSLGKETWNKILDITKLDEDEKQAIIDSIKDENGKIDWNEVKKNLKETTRQNLVDELEYYVKKNGLLSFNDFKSLSTARKNNRDARNTRICEIMINVLSSPEALEENLSRSNSDDIKAALKDCYSSVQKKERESRSPYNFLDQSKFYEDAVSGIRLKARSVIRDTMLSVANTIKPHIEDAIGIKIFYPSKKYTKKDLINRYGERYIKPVKGGYVVTHINYGWSKDYKNVDDKLITPYSSQTTAFILDAIKTGAIPNVNELTFGIFKTIVDFGSNYDTAVSFIMQPGVTRIVNAYLSTNSIYSKDKNKNHIDAAIISIGKDLDLELSDKPTREQVINAIKKKYGTIENYVFNADIQKERLHKIGSPVEENKEDLLYDLSVILAYERLAAISDNIDSIAKISNPDKFGAKQTLYATNEVFDKLIDYAKGKGTLFSIEDGTDFIYALYPFLSEYRKLYLSEFGIENVRTEELFDFNEENSIIKLALESNPKDSKYEPLAYFIKYATATSIAINSKLFKTQQFGFRKAVNNLSKFTTNHRKLDEKSYNAYKDYIIQYITNSTRFISTPLHYELGKGFDYVSADDVENDFGEVERIYGYNRTPNFSVIINDNDVEFTIQNINNPTQDELNVFEKLSPAQKVAWLKENIRESDQGILKYVDVSLFNDRGSRRTKFGSQTIEFAENNTSIEQIYSDFEQGFRSYNPLIALTHADIIKYAFVVEGYKIGTKNVSKMIPNSILIEDGPIMGTGMVRETNDKINNMHNIINDADLINKIMSNFVRSHSTLPIIGTRFVSYDKKSGYGLIRRGGKKIGIIQIGQTKEGVELLEKYGFAFNIRETQDGFTYDTNKYGKLVFQFEKETTLYELISDSATRSFYLIPINTLETNENGTWSANPENNRFEPRDFYIDLIQKYSKDYKDRIFNSADFRSTITELKKSDDYKTKYKSPIEKKSIETFAKPFTKEEKEESGYYNHLAKAVDEWVKKGYESEELVHVNGGLSDHIFGYGKRYALFDSIVYKDYSGKIKPIGNFSIYRYDPYKLIVNYVNDTIEYEADRKTIKHVVSNIDRSVSKLDNVEKQVVEILRERRRRIGKDISRNINDIYIVIPNNILSNEVEKPTRVFSDILDDAAAESVASINRDVRKGIKSAVFNASKFREKGITAEKDIVKANTNTIISIMQPYIVNKAKEIEDRLKYFMKNEEGNMIPITDKKVITEIKKNKKLRKLYVEAVLARNAFLDEYKGFTALNVTSEDPEIRYDLEKIQKAITTIQTLPIAQEAFRNYATEYIDRISKAPLIKDKMISVLSGFWDSNWADAMFNDIQENPHPIIQITMKEFMNNSRADYDNTKELAREFRKWYEDVVKRANTAGKEVNLTKIFDDYGRFRQKYTPEFIEDNKNKYNDVLKAKEKFGAYSVEHLKARLAYNEWLAENVEQEAVKEYYDTINKAEREILYGRPSFDPYTGEPIMVDASPELYAKYEELRNKRLDYLRSITTDEPDPILDAKIADINKEIESLSSSWYMSPITGRYELKEDDPSVELNTPEERLKYALTSQYHASILRNFLDKKITANNEYFTTDEVEGFEDKLKHNLSIINERELRNPDGTPKFNEAQLARDTEYQKAKAWIKRNTYRVIDDSTGWKKELDDAYKTLNKEFDVDGTKRSKVAWNPKLTSGSIDSDGILDATTLSDAEIKDLRDKELIIYHNSENIPFSDRILMSNGNPDKDVVYNNAFYRSLAGKTKIDKEANAHWFRVITEINDLLADCWDTTTQRVQLNKIPNTKEGIDKIKKLRKLYDELAEITKATYEDDETRNAHKKWLEENVDIVINEEAYNNDLLWIEGQKNEYGRALNGLIKNLNPMFEVIPNTYLYGYLKPKEDTFKEFKTGKKFKSVNEVKTKALATIRKYTTTTPTKYYYDKFNEMFAKSKEEFAAWYYTNHIYNGYTHQFQPLRCWTKVQYGDGTNFTYKPSFGQTTRVPKEEYVNPKHKNGSIGLNYNTDSHNYDAELNLNEFEQEVADHIHEILDMLVQENKSKKYIEEGWLPSRREHKKQTLKNVGIQTLKTLGMHWDDAKEDDFYSSIQYYKNTPKMMPMLEQIADKHKEKNKLAFPKKDDPEYDRKRQEWQEEEDRVNKDNLELHKKLHDKDYISVIEEFILKAGLYNSVQNNSYMLFYALEFLKQYGNYTQKYWAFGDLKKGIGSTEEDKVYAKQIDNQLIKQLEVTINRLVYNQWKQPYGNLTKVLNFMQSYTSSTYMMLNLKGGIANVTLGESQIISEAFAREFFGHKAKVMGDLEYDKGIPDYILHAYDDKASTTQGAVIKFFDCVDYDEHNGEVKIASNPDEIFEKIRNLGFSMQTSGEHKMQNSALLTMLMSHRLVENPNSGEFGQPKFMFANLNEYTNMAHENALLSILNEEEKAKYKAYKEATKKDANMLKDYAWYRKDFTTEFVLRLSKDTQDKFIQARNKLIKELKDDFENDDKHPTIYSQLKCGKDGYMEFVEGSKLAELNVKKDDNTPSDAHMLLAEFKGRVISVNKKIHGVYDKSGRAQIESTVPGGSLLMQYHKHIPMSITKRYRMKGMFSEERGAVDKGIYTSIYDFLSIPFKRHQDKLNMTDDEVTTAMGIQNIVKEVLNFAFNVRHFYHLLPEYDRANIRRGFGNILGTLSSLFLALAAKCLLDDDEDSWVYNIAMYEADRLATETTQYSLWFPPSSFSEIKKQLQSPIAAGNGVQDLINSTSMLCQLMLQGDDFDPEYHSGQFAGENKLTVYIQRRIPIWRGVKSAFIDIYDNNHYYKIGSNVMGFVNMDNTAKALKGEDVRPW